MVESFYLAIYVISLLIIGIATMITGDTYGEAINVHIGAAGIFVLLVVYLLTYILINQFYKKTRYDMPRIKGFPKFEINREKIHSFIFICLVICTVGTVMFDIGRVKGTVVTVLSPLFSMIKVTEFFPIYYIIAREEKKKLYWINIVLYCVMRTMQGWSGWIMTIAVLELFMRLKKNRGWLKNIFRTFKAKVLSVVGIVAGGFIYYFAYPYKNAVRYETSAELFKITIWESFTKLIERFCNFAVFTSVWQNIDDIISCYKKQGIFLSEFKIIFSPILPSFIMRNKDIRGIGNLVQQAMWPTLENGTSTGCGFLAYWYSLFRCSFLDFVVCVAMFLFCFLLTCSILNAFDNEGHDVRILYFMFLIGIANGSSLSNLIGYGYIASLYLILFMFLFGAIRVRIPYRRCVIGERI